MDTRDAIRKILEQLATLTAQVSKQNIVLQEIQRDIARSRGTDELR